MFNALPMFQRIGASAFKKDLKPTLELCKRLGNPHKKFKSVHIAGTNGKGSTSHMIASILQEEGYKVGLYTSPHLKSFTERIRVNGSEIDQEAVIQFVSKNRPFLDEIKPSFFEMTVAMAFDYFAQTKVDIAVIEVGMGGRFDSTNVINPILSIITQIGMDHMQFLGNTLAEIAVEKAGIIKHHVPVVIGQTQLETEQIFRNRAAELDAPIYFADQELKVESVHGGGLEKMRRYDVKHNGEAFSVRLDLLGSYQRLNLPGVLVSARILTGIGFPISVASLSEGLANVIRNTGLKGRWQILGQEPLIICDTGHNVDGIKVILNQLLSYTYSKLYMVLGVVKDKDLSSILPLLPRDAEYIFCQPNLPRSLDAAELSREATTYGLAGKVIADVNDAIQYAQSQASKNDLIFIGGSTFVVAEIANL